MLRVGYIYFHFDKPTGSLVAKAASYTQDAFTVSIVPISIFVLSFY